MLQLLVDGVMDRLRLALGVARADHEEVGVGDDAAQVDHPDVDRLAVGGDGGDALGQGGGVRASAHAALMPSSPPRVGSPAAAAVQLARRDVARPPVGDQVADRRALADPPAHRGRRDLDQRHVEVADASAPRSRPILMPIPLRVQLGALDHRHGGVLEHPLGLVPGRQRRGLVSAQDQEQLVLGRLRAQRRERVRRVRGALAVDLDPRDTRSARRRRSPAPPSRGAPRRPGRPRACGAAPGPPARRRRRSSPSCSSDSCAHTRWPRCGGLKAPPKIPTRKRSGTYSRTWPEPSTTNL